MSNPKPLVLVDGSSYLYRAFHALPPLSNSRGEPTGAIHGVLNMLNRLLKDYEPERVAVVFDARGKTFRDDLFEQYKANRPPMPDELRSQVEPLLEAVAAMGLPLLRVQGVEADDVIGTLARRAATAGHDTLISTGDKDMAQLVDRHVTLVNTMTNKTMDRDGVKEKFDVYPEQIVDYLALVGDSSDNIPGVPKVGPKTAAKWLNQYDTLDNIIAHADEIPGKVGESLRENLVQLELSRKLATIDCDVALDLEPEQLTQSAPDLDTLRELYTRLEMNSLLRQLPGAGQDAPDAMTPQPAAMKTHYHIVLTLAELRSWKTRLEKAELSALDTETTGLDYMQAELVGVCISVQAGEAAYIPVAHDYPGAPEQLARDTVLAELKPWLENSEHLKVGHHIKYDAHILARYDINLRGIAHDTMLESYVLDSTATRHDMDSVARKYLGVETTSFEQVAGKGAKQLTFNQVELGLAAHYAAEDADITLRLHQVMWERLSHHTMLRQVYQDIEIPLVSVLQHMEHTGVLIDTFMLARQSKELAQGMHELELQAHEAAGGPFNVASPKQLQEILFERLQLPVIRKTPKGQPSTAEDVLQELAIDYPLPRLILEHRSMAKLKSTYTDKLPGQVDRTTGRVHTSYHQAVAATGRLSSSDPNLQNIPIRTAEGRRIRQAFIAPKGYCLIAADYSQIELRIMAHLSGDPGLLKAFAEDRDIHQATAAEVFGVDLDAVSKDQRRSAKAINFGLIYGMSAFGLARQLNIGRSEAQDYVNLYFERYPGVKAYMDNTRKLAKEQGYVETVFGRRLYLPEINSRNGQLRQYAERSAINAPMQGTAADIIKLAMIGVDTWLQSSPVDARLIMQVHDELVVEVRDEEAAAVQKELVRRMSQAASLKVPLKVDAARGLNWDEAH
ncbi:MAG: DNA polymerase I [Gammaproteobacteria bacterium]|jgi:DNA polymerase-1|nr:DNA polymerase I [Gammaproteobacteria bacterium]